jgi:hypothetical protein
VSDGRQEEGRTKTANRERLRPLPAVPILPKMANSLDRSSELHRTYAPVDLTALRNADEAQPKGGARCAASNPRTRAQTD